MRVAPVLRTLAAAACLTVAASTQAEAYPLLLHPCTAYCLVATQTNCMPDHLEDPQVCTAYYAGCEFSCRYM